jgi:hypothetical protein
MIRALSLLTALFVPSLALAQPTFSEGASGAAAPSTDDIDFTLTAGGTLSYGNARTVGLNVAGNLTIHEGSELFVAEVTYVYGVAQSTRSCADVIATGGPADALAYCMGTMGMPLAPSTRAGFNDFAENASNLNWRLRYDHFFDPDNAIFLAHRGRIDYFAGLDLRLGLQLGYNRMLFREEHHTLAMDVGVDATVDIYSESVRAQNRALIAAGTSLPNLAGTDARLIPALRMQLAYVNHLNAALTYDTTFEALWDIPNPEHFRFEWVNRFRSAIETWLQISLDLTFRLDSLPPGQARSWNEVAFQPTQMFDMLATLNLVGSFDLDGEPPPPAPAEEEPACPEPSCPACPETAPAEAAPAEAAPAEAEPAEAAPAETAPAPAAG